MTRSTPYGLPSQWSSIQASSISSSSGVNASAPSTPKPPARLTAATTSRQWEKAKIGNSMPNLSQTGVRTLCLLLRGAGEFLTGRQVEGTVRPVTPQPQDRLAADQQAAAQKATAEFETPTPEQIVAISAQHVAMMETSVADDTWVWVGMEHLLLHTIGR